MRNHITEFSNLEQDIVDQQQDALPAASEPRWETMSDDDFDDDASVAKHVGRQVKREVSDTVVSDYNDEEEIMLVAARMPKIEISERATPDHRDSLIATTLLTATGSVRVSCHHTDEVYMKSELTTLLLRNVPY